MTTATLVGDGPAVKPADRLHTITVLRDLVPIRPLSQLEALRIAELQADRLLTLAGRAQPAVPDELIESIPKVQVRRMRPWPVSGCTDWAKSTWVIVLNAGEPYVRQRFSLAHEFKHILDHRFVDVIYPDLPRLSSQQRAEVVCDYFAGCLLVPKKWLRQAWTAGIQTEPGLARHFNVSREAIRTRLSQTGLIERTPRCDVSMSPRTRRYYRIGECADVPALLQLEAAT